MYYSRLKTGLFDAGCDDVGDVQRRSSQPPTSRPPTRPHLQPLSELTTTTHPRTGGCKSSERVSTSATTVVQQPTGPSTSPADIRMIACSASEVRQSGAAECSVQQRHQMMMMSAYKACLFSAASPLFPAVPPPASYVDHVGNR